MRLLFCSVAVALLAGCGSSSAPDEGSTTFVHVWVEQRFHNGNGGNFVGPVPPDTAGLLASAGIESAEIAVQGLAMCMGPGCPTYASIHYAKIAARHVGRAADLGFELSGGPPR